MFSWNDPKDRAKIVRLTADLRAVQVELHSAMCAADRLRLHYHVQDIARFGERPVLHKSHLLGQVVVCLLFVRCGNAGIDSVR